MRKRAISMPLLVEPCGEEAMNSAVAARVTALFLPTEGSNAGF